MAGLLKSSLAALIAGGLMATAAAQQPTPTFEVASIKYRGDQRILVPPVRTPPGVFYSANATVEGLVRYAYNILNFQLIGGPDWIRTDQFEIDARAAGDVPTEQMRLMVQSLLEDRFKLVIRHEQREMPSSALVLAREDGRLGPKLERCDDPENQPPPTPLRIPPGGVPFTGRCRPVSAIARGVSGTLGTPVVDRTGLTGLWNFELVFLQLQPLPPGRQRDLADQENVPSFATALQEQLGLKLESGRGPVDVLVIDSVEQSTEN